MILETQKQDMIKSWYCLFYGFRANICPSHNFLFMEIFSLTAIPRLQRQPPGGVLQIWKENEKYLRKSTCFYKSTTILKMNSFIAAFMDINHRYGTILWKPTVEGRAFCKKAIFVEHLVVASSRGYSEYYQKFRIEYFAKIVNA